MDSSSNWRPSQAGEQLLENPDWRTQLQPDSRQRIVNKIMETLKRHLPFSGQEGLQELKKIAVRFEEKIYSAATSQSDYLRKISLKMLTMENKSNPMPNPMQSNSAVNNMNSPDPGLQGMQSQVNNSTQLLPIPIATNNQSQTLLGQNTINNGSVVPTGLQGASGSLSQNSNITNVNVQNPNMQNISGISQNPNSYANSQRQQVRQQQPPQSSQQQYLYQQQQQLQQQLMKQKFNNISQFHQQQQQQPNNNNSNQLMQPPAIQQNQQQPSAQQTTPAVLQQSVLRQQRQQPTMLQQQSVLPAQQQQQQQNPHLVQQNQLNNVTDMQQQRLIGQQNNNMQQQQQQMMMSQPNNLANIQQQMVQQSKVSVQQPAQQNSSNLLQPSQQSQSQQMVSNMQSQQMNLQQQQQQQPNNSTQAPQRIQTSGTNMLQQQNLTDQQKQQIFQSHRPNPEASSTSLDSTGGNTNAGDWQEEIFQKIKIMKDTYLVELNEMYQKISGKLQQHDSLSQHPKNDQYDKFRMFKQMMERLISFLQVQKQHIIPTLKDKLGPYEKQIINVLSQHRPRKQVSLPPTHMHPMQQQQQQQQPQSQPQVHDNQMNPQISTINLQNNSMSPLPGVVPNPQTMNSLQETNASSLQQQNPSGLIKQEQQQMLQTQQMKQQFQQRQMQQQFLQKQQLLQQQAKLHQVSDGSNSNNDMKMRQQIGNVKLQQQQQQQRAAFHHQQQIKQGSPFSISSPLLQSAGSPQISQHPSPQIDQQNLLNSLTKAGTPLQNVNSPFIAPSPSTPLAPSPMPGESDRVNAGVSSLSNNNINNSYNNIGQHHQQTSGAVLPAQSLAIGTPGISASPLLAEFIGTDGINGTTLVSATKSSGTEQPLDRLLRAVKSMSPQALNASVSDIGSVVSMIDRIAGSAPGNGSRAAVGEDLVAMTKCRLQARNFTSQDGSNNNNHTATRKMKRYTSAMPLSVASSDGAGGIDDSFKKSVASGVSDLESTSISNSKKPRLKANHAIVEEIREINQRLIDTVVEISNEDIDPTAAGAAAIDGHEGTVVKCSFSAVALGPNLKSQYASAQMSPIQPLRLLLPTNYPNSSPILLDKLPVEAGELEDLSVKAKSRFSISLRGLSQPMSLGEIAKIWDICARAVISEYAQQSGGGSFSSKYGSWEICTGAA